VCGQVPRAATRPDSRPMSRHRFYLISVHPPESRPICRPTEFDPTRFRVGEQLQRLLATASAASRAEIDGPDRQVFAGGVLGHRTNLILKLPAKSDVRSQNNAGRSPIVGRAPTPLAVEATPVPWPGGRKGGIGRSEDAFPYGHSTIASFELGLHTINVPHE
jgi:hypothetical protein